MQTALSSIPIANKRTILVGYGGRVQDMEFQENPMIRRKDTAKKVQCSTSKIPFIIDPSSPTSQELCVMGLNVRYRDSGKFLEWKKRYGRQDTLLSKKCPSFTD